MPATARQRPAKVLTWCYAMLVPAPVGRVSLWRWQPQSVNVLAPRRSQPWPQSGSARLVESSFRFRADTVQVAHHCRFQRPCQNLNKRERPASASLSAGRSLVAPFVCAATRAFIMAVLTFQRYAASSFMAALVIIWHAFATRRQCVLCCSAGSRCILCTMSLKHEARLLHETAKASCVGGILRTRTWWLYRCGAYAARCLCSRCQWYAHSTLSEHMHPSAATSRLCTIWQAPSSMWRSWVTSALRWPFAHTSWLSRCAAALTQEQQMPCDTTSARRSNAGLLANK